MAPAIVVHGGAGDIPSELLEAYSAGCREAVLRGWRVLERGGSALDAVEAAIVYLEDDPAFDAGTGSFLNVDGEVELDAGLMAGATLDAGAVAAVHRVRNPILLARHVLGSQLVLVVGQGATRLAEEVGMPLCEEADLIVERERELWQKLRAATPTWRDVVYGRKGGSTVGAVAVDRLGHVVAGVSTGGSPYKWPGRVGDVPLVGCGFYADDAEGGAACSGWGEGISRVAMARYAVERLAAGDSAAEAARQAVKLLGDRVQGFGGIILLDREGRVGQAHTTERMAYAYLTAEMAEPIVAV